MKNKFVADGYRRFLQGRKTMTAESIEKKLAAELANASPAQKENPRTHGEGISPAREGAEPQAVGGDFVVKEVAADVRRL